ncbi:hypothetical protein [Haloglycomyces albus]|uniref:hypothetical protein n=1 Tax=Haloglycomyces albus TaxID=526067 RepID=UPI00046D7E5A|nr:hypothetical protein [Haloglycomyces albus]
MAERDRVLIIIEKAYRGAVEAQFVDSLYFIRELNRQMGDLKPPDPQGGLDVYLRDFAVTYALDRPGPPAVELSGQNIDTLPDPRATIRALISEDVTVLADASDCDHFNRSGTALLSGVRRIAAEDMTAQWPHYRHVWFF